MSLHIRIANGAVLRWERGDAPPLHRPIRILPSRLLILARMRELLERSL